MRRKTVSEIIASRLKDIRARRAEVGEESKKEQNEQGYAASKMASVLDKEHLDNEDRLFLLQWMQQKERVCFNAAFPVSNIKWLVSKQRILIDKNYDSARTSMYIFRGQLYFYKINAASRQDLCLVEESVTQKQQSSQILAMSKWQGIGHAFQQKQLQRCTVVGQNVIVLVVQHAMGELKLIEKNCLLTSKQKQQVVGRFSLFEDFEHLKKNYLPFFMAKKYSKNDNIYEVGDTATHFYLLFKGQVEFMQIANQKYPNGKAQKQDGSPIKQLRRKSNKKTVLIVTQKIGQGCCFGQEELINQARRGHTARCLSAECLLLMLDQQIFRKLMSYQGFACKIKTLGQSNLREKQSKLQTFVKIQQPPSQQSTEQTHQSYNLFKVRVLNRLQQSQKIQQQRKLSLRRSKQKIMHGHTLKIPRNTNCVTEESQSSFSMLKVNQSMYLKTLKRFRHSLKEIEQQKKPKKRVELSEGRSLQMVWNALGLKDIFSDSEEEQESRQWQRSNNGRTYYESHLKIKRNLRDNSAFRPKGLTSNCRLKKQYLQYLQKCI